MRIPVISWIVSVLALVGLLAWVGSGILPVDPNGGGHGEAAIGGPFTLVDGNGNRVTDKTFRGRYMLVFFGFTHCPDICPTTLSLLDSALQNLGKKGNTVVPILITVDPERDTPKVIGDYVKHFGDRIVGLSGSREQINAVLAAYKVYASKIENDDAALGYMMNHSSFIYLMGPDGRYITHFEQNTPEKGLVEQLQKYVK